MARRIVIAINGLPRSGKDTVSDFAIRHLKRAGWRGHSVSSVDPIRDMLRAQGVPVDFKRPDERRLMAEVKSAFENYNWLATRLCARQVQDWLDMVPEADAICFAHMREAAAIEKFCQLFPAPIQTLRLLVSSPRGELVTNNVADRDVMNTTYDLTITNDGTLEELDANVGALVARLIKEEMSDDNQCQDSPAVA